MGTYTLVVQPDGNSPLDVVIAAIENIDPLLDELADDVLPLLERNYDSSGLHTGKDATLKQAVSKRGARGNYIIASGGRLRIGVDESVIPYARWAIGGRGAVRARNKRALHFDINGKNIYVKSVRAAPPHPIFYLTQADLTLLEGKLSDRIAQQKGKIA